MDNKIIMNNDLPEHKKKLNTSITAKNQPTATSTANDATRGQPIGSQGKCRRHTQGQSQEESKTPHELVTHVHKSRNLRILSIKETAIFKTRQSTLKCKPEKNIKKMSSQARILNKNSHLNTHPNREKEISINV